jgi:hypothetical protein
MPSARSSIAVTLFSSATFPSTSCSSEVVTWACGGSPPIRLPRCLDRMPVQRQVLLARCRPNRLGSPTPGGARSSRAAGQQDRHHMAPSGIEGHCDSQRRSSAARPFAVTRSFSSVRLLTKPRALRRAIRPGFGSLHLVSSLNSESALKSPFRSPFLAHLFRNIDPPAWLSLRLRCGLLTSASRNMAIEYLDLADDRWRAVEVGPEGWQVITCSPVRFRRAAGMLPLPRAPVRMLQGMICRAGVHAGRVLLAHLPAGCVRHKRPFGRWASRLRLVAKDGRERGSSG